MYSVQQPTGNQLKDVTGQRSPEIIINYSTITHTIYKTLSTLTQILTIPLI